MLRQREFNWQVQSVLLYVVYLIVKNLLDSDSKQITVGRSFLFSYLYFYAKLLYLFQ